MVNNNCLNCENELTDKFCSRCGQKADTHRISFKNFIYHDLLHGTFHIEKGMLFTAKQALIRPGQAATDYISGKRKRFYNIFLLILITIGIMLFTRHMDQFFIDQSTELIQEEKHMNEASRRLDEIFSHKSKIILLLFVPFAALNSFILFRKRKWNFSEHVILSGMILLGILLISVFSNVVFQVNQILSMNTTVLSWIVTAIILMYTAYAYYNAFAADYSKPGIALLIILYFIFICIEILLLLYILIGYATDWKFTEVTVTPFG